MNFKKLFRPHIFNLKPYSSARDEYTGSEGVFLDANENPLGSVAKGDYNRYPDPYQREIKQKLGKLKGIAPNHIFLGNGSDEPIDLIIQATCKPEVDEMIIMPPTYGMYQVCADIHQAKTIEVPLTKDFQLDVDGIQKAINSNTKLVWICSPNNPTGNSLSSTDIEDLVSSNTEVLFIIDEAYIDFSNAKSFISKIHTYSNLMVLQTFSKAWGMAGLRVGAAYANEGIIKILNKIKYPYNLNIATQRIVLEALESVGTKDEMVAEINKNRAEMEKELQMIKSTIHIFPSDSNQLLVKFKDAKGLFEKLLSKKVIVRDRTKIQLCQDCLRISVGTRDENYSLINAIKDIE